MDDEVAVLALPDTCGSEEHCISACPEDAIQMRWLPFSGNRNVGRWNDDIG
jgi:NAD-dependent dihydropyrimidine dehydrogenase PreA subunit